MRLLSTGGAVIYVMSAVTYNMLTEVEHVSTWGVNPEFSSFISLWEC